MKHRFLKHSLLLLTFVITPSALLADRVEQVSSPNGNLTVTAGTDDSGHPYYKLSRGGQEIITRSALGYLLTESINDFLDNDFDVSFSNISEKDETWHQPWGEEDAVRNHYKELTMHLQRRGGLRIKLDVVFRVFDNGFGFRYVIPKQDCLRSNNKDITLVISDEKTEFNFKGDLQAWTIPYDTKAYEREWGKGPLSGKKWECTPMTIEANPNLYMMLHEANLTDYSPLCINNQGFWDDIAHFKVQLVGWERADIPNYQKNHLVYTDYYPFYSPWRMLAVETTPGGLITNRVMLNLNDPCKIEDTSWLKTGKYVGIWWTLHLNDFSWSETDKPHGATNNNTRHYIDFASEHGFEGVLVEGWNKGWNGMQPVVNDLSMTESTPDYDFRGLQKYAHDNGTSIIVHNETGGYSKRYENQMEKAFSLYQSVGANVIKTGYVGDFLNTGGVDDWQQLPHSQYGVRHFRKVIEEAAKHHLMVINHEPVMPTGLQRTYPNLLSGEGVKGQEWNAWSTGSSPSHTVTIPFTRGLAGPMDFTPSIFKFLEVNGDSRPHTTLAKQLAEFVCFYTPWQMAADKIENYQNNPRVFTFLENIPSNWEKTIVPDAKIGEYIVTARQARGTNNWYIGGMTDANARTINLRLDFLKPGKKYTAVVYEDGDNADYKKNPYPVNIYKKGVNNNSVLPIKMACSGGFAIQIVENYDVEAAALSWERVNGGRDIKDGDGVRFKMAVLNTGDTDIPVGEVISAHVLVDGVAPFATVVYKGGLKRGQSVVLETRQPWTATTGAHTLTATIGYGFRLPGDDNASNNSRTKKINVKPSGEEGGDYIPVRGGYDLYIRKVSIDEQSVPVNGMVKFVAEVVNAGDQPAPINNDALLGLGFRIDGKYANSDLAMWSDHFRRELQPGETVKVYVTGSINNPLGPNSDKWQAAPGYHYIRVWVDDVNRLKKEVNESNNIAVVVFKFPYDKQHLTTFSTGDQPDDVYNVSTGIAEIITPADKQSSSTSRDDAYYDLQGRRIGTSKDNLKRGIYIHKGKKVIVR